MANSLVYVGPLSSPAFGNTAGITQYGPYASARLAEQYAINSGSEPSLATELLGAGAFMGAIQVTPKAIHPIKSFNAAKQASAAYKDLAASEAFQKLSPLEKSKAYSTLFNTERLQGKVLKEGLRSAKETQTLKKAINTATNSYKAALKAGNTAQAAQHAQELNTIISAGKKQGWFSRTIKKLFSGGKQAAPKVVDCAEVLKQAKTAGTAANTAAKAAAATAAEATTKTAKAGNWFKSAIKSGGFKGMAIIEGVLETVTEVIPAFSHSASSGVKQTAKSAVTVAASATGWCVGAKAGASAGAAIGTAIFPGIGSAIGGVIGGLAGGIIGSWGARKVSKAVVGKSFSEQQEEQEKLTQAKMLQQIQAQPLQTQAQTGTINQNPFGYASNPFINDLPDYDYSNLSNIGLY